jgi:hypothetical protein
MLADETIGMYGSDPFSPKNIPEEYDSWYEEKQVRMRENE